MCNMHHSGIEKLEHTLLSSDSFTAALTISPLKSLLPRSSFSKWCPGNRSNNIKFNKKDCGTVMLVMNQI